MRKTGKTPILTALVFILAGISLTASSSVQAASAYSDAEIKATRSENEKSVDDLRDQEITQLRIALGRRIPGNRRADLYVRLAEIYLEAYRMEFLLEGRVHERRLSQGKADPIIDRGHSKPYVSLGIKACEDIINLHINVDKMDQIFYFLAVNYGELNREKESLQYFQMIVQRYPDSAYVGEANRALGDDSFEKQMYKHAEAYYEAALKNYKGESYPRVLHKMAWTYYRLKMFDRAIATMKEAITKSASSGDKFVSLREEALRDMAIFMTEAGQTDEAIAYFQGVSGDKSFYARVLEKLGRQYERNVEMARAIQVYEALIKTSPESEAAFRVRTKLLDLDQRRGQVLEGLNRIRGVKLLTSGKESETETVARNLRATVRKTGTESHEVFRKKGTHSALLIAEAYYQAYLDLFLSVDDSRKETPEIQMYLADVKRELGKSQEASVLYRKVVDSGDSRYAKEAGALWTASLADAIKKSKAGGTNETGDLSPLEKEFIEAADHLQKAFSEMPEGREAALKAAEVLAGYKSAQKDSIKRAKKIIKTWPTSPQALTAAHLWIQILTDRLPSQMEKMKGSDAADDLKDAIKDLRENSVLMTSDHESGKDKLKLLLAEQDTRLRIGVIARHENEKDYSAAAKDYERFAADADKRDLAEKAYGNSIVSYVKTSDFESVPRVYDAWSLRYPDSKMSSDSMRAAATGASIQGNFEAAAGLFEKLGRQNEADSLEFAARIYEGIGNTAKARDCFQLYLTKYKTSPRLASIALALAQSFETEKNSSEALKYYQICFEGPSDIGSECGARIADLDKSRSREIFGKISGASAQSVTKSKGKKQAETFSPFVGYARYRLAEIMEHGAKLAPLKLPEASLKKALDQRLEFMQQLNRAYQSAVEAGGPWAIAALDRLAAWVLAFADEIDQIDGKPAFKKNLQSISNPLRQKAMETWKGAYQKAVNAEILSPALPRIADHLSNHAQGYRGKFRLSGLAADGGPDGRTTAYKKVREKLTLDRKNAGAWADYGNLLWGENRPLLAKIAYDRALTLEPTQAQALNNRGVMNIGGSGEEDWLRTGESFQFFKDALKREPTFAAAKLNSAIILNYYRNFAKAMPLWRDLEPTVPGVDVYDGLAIALQGLGDKASAENTFGRATEAGGKSKRFALKYHEAARVDLTSADAAEKCVSLIGKLDSDDLNGFEKQSTENLKEICSQWKTEK